MLLDTIPDTSAYLFAGYAVFFTVTFLYIASLFWRQRKLRREREMLDELKQ